jgi:hypothetical protein
MRRFIHTIAVLGLILLATTPLIAAESADLQFVGSTLWSGIKEVAVQGNYAYCAAYYGLVIVDISHPATPTFVSQLLIDRGFNGVAPGDDHMIQVSGNYVYFGQNTDGIVVIDVSNPAQPQVKAHFGSAYDYFAIAGHYAYVLGAQMGLYIFDISDPTAPMQVGNLINSISYAKGIEVSGDYAYVVQPGTGLRIINVSNPSAPWETMLYRPQFSNVEAIAIHANRAYLTDPAGMTILDISNPDTPVAVGDYRPSTLVPVYASDIYNNYVLLQHYGYYDIVDVSDPSHPVAVAGNLGNYIAYNVTVNDNYLYIASWYDGVIIKDLTTIPAPTLIGTYTTPSEIRAIDCSGHYAYLCSGNGGMIVCDIADPTRPQAVSQYVVPGVEYTDLAISGSHAFLENKKSLQIFDLSDPVHPTLAGTYPHPLSGNFSNPRITLAGSQAVIAAGEYGFVILDISNPSAPVELSVTNPNYGRRAVCAAVSGNICCVQFEYVGIHIYDITDPAHPQLQSIYPWDIMPLEALELNGGLLYVNLPSAEKAFRVIDISRPTAPRDISSADGYYDANQLVRDHEFLFTGQSDNGIVIQDLYNSSRPLEIGIYNTPGCALGLCISDTLMYVADRFAFTVLSVKLPTLKVGDYDGGGTINVGDAVGLINYIFKAGAPPVPMRAGDVNCDGKINVSDIIRLINHIFKGAPAPGCD